MKVIDTMATKIKPLLMASIIAVAGLGHTVLADQNPVQGTLALPHALHVIMDNKAEFEVTAKQMEQFKTELMGVYPAKMRPRMKEITEREQALRKEVMLKHLSAKQAEAELKQLGEVKLQLSLDHIRAMNTLAAILNESQWDLMLEKLHEKHDGKHAHDEKTASQKPKGCSRK